LYLYQFLGGEASLEKGTCEIQPWIDCALLKTHLAGVIKIGQEEFAYY
jgi:hypothetical protein